MKTILFFFLLSGSLLSAGSPERANLIMRQYDLAYARWIRDVRTAPDNDAQNAAWLRRPDEEKAGRNIWEEIQGSLSKSWVLDPAAWLLANSPGYATAAPQGRKSPVVLIRMAVRRHHLRSSKLAPYCIGLTHVQDPASMAVLETVEKVNPSQGVKGAAALAQAILHRRLGEGKLFMAKRQENLRTAIKSPDVTVGKTTTQAILRDELFRMNRLNVGVEAPDFGGVEVDLNKSRLKDYKGKVTILFFWHAFMPACDDSLALFRKYTEAFKGKDIEILGVNMDNPLKLREYIAKGTVTWRNFSDPTQIITKLYRIEKWPAVYVLDHEHKIRYQGEPGAFVKIAAEDLERELAKQKAGLKKPGEGQ